MTNEDIYKYKGIVERAVDGDTIIIMCDLGFDVFKRVTVRLLNINTPELKSGNPLAQEAKEFISKLLTGKQVFFNSKRYDKYGRSTAEIFLDGVSVNELMIFKGYAVRVKY